VLVLFGGKSAEHEVSIISASSVMNAMDPAKYDVIPVMITQAGRWLRPKESAKVLEQVRRPLKTPDRPPVGTDGSPLIRVNTTAAPGIDVVFPVLHGPFGEDGTVQGLLELANVPYVGSGVTGSAVGMDKDLMKRLFREAGLPVVDFVLVTRARWRRARKAVLREMLARFDLPVFVKPACLGSSVGIRRVRNRGELERAMDFAARYDTKLLVEEGLTPLELECAVLGNEEPIASCVGQIIPPGGFYDYEEKYVYDRTQLVIPARITKRVAERVRKLSVLAYKAVDCAGMARVDFLLDKPAGRLCVSELNTIPGFTSISMYPKMWEHSGLPYPKLLDRLIELAIERHADRADVRVER
jgi:D-alanine-D-alanine ligase